MKKEDLILHKLYYCKTYPNWLLKQRLVSKHKDYAVLEINGHHSIYYYDKVIREAGESDPVWIKEE